MALVVVAMPLPQVRTISFYRWGGMGYFWEDKTPPDGGHSYGQAVLSFCHGTYIFLSEGPEVDTRWSGIL
ncbi:hypothetical protein SAMN05192559_10561 [Halobacillus karajensis]|nr:hypothetical protein SAMN05192559_10561 [Halobacillus karajensis]